MELFKITCVTCRARLSVRDAALVGQILACPRCGMMVQVAAPAATSVAGGAGASDPSITITAQPAPRVAEANASAPAVATFDDAADAMAPADAVSQPPPPAAGSPPETSWLTYKFAGLIAAATIVGSAIVATALSWFSNDDPVLANAAVAATSTLAAETAGVAPPNKPNAELADATPAKEEATEAAVDPAVEPPAALKKRESDAKAEAVSMPTVEDPPPAPADLALATTEPPVVADDAETDAPPAAARPKPRLTIDPLDIDPEGLDLASLYSGPSKDPLAESHLPAEAPTSGTPPEADRDPAAEAAPAVRETVRRDAHAPVGAPAAAAPLLARRLPAVKLEKMPLCQTLDFAVQLSGLPVSVAPVELRRARVTAATPASVDARDMNVEQLLTAALQPLRLRPVVSGEQILLRGVDEDKRRSVDYAIDDLATHPAEMEQLAAWVQQLAAPEIWKSAGGDATLAVQGTQLHVEALQSAQYEVLLLLERYRMARSLPMRSKYPKSLLSAEPSYIALMKRLSGTVTFTFTQYTPLREILRYWQEELDVAVLVDWPALAEERLWPQSRIACSAAYKSWADAMDAVLDPLGLAWRTVDGRTIEITAKTKAAAEPQLELYRLAANATITGEELAAKLSELAASGGKAAGATGYDSTGRIFFVRQPAAVHRAFADWLLAQKLLAE